ncbi:MAG TPA: von Willebrand factor type A domain-containing protein [Bacteroidales bacterium]|nr:von Willebrand factor type A domain-containing protein [Bacteroidales bacterium]
MKALLSFITLVLLTILPLQAQITITGTVTDITGTPLPGASIMVKDTVCGTVADYNGNYSIKVNNRAAVLVFSFIGFRRVEENIAGRTVINVAMEEDATKLEEITVVGYAVQRKTSICASSMQSVSPGSYRGNFNTEGYSAINENGFKNVTRDPLSTFSIDVDKASYSNVRRFLNMGQVPPEDAVRVEEMINYFKYDYPEPNGDYPFSVYTEVGVCPWNTSHNLLHIGLKGKSIDKESLPPSNIVFLMDVSGSMDEPNKLPLLKSAFSMLVDELRPQDRVAIVVYAGAAGVVLNSTPGNRKEEIKQAIDNLEAGGSTAGGEGLLLAYKIAEENFVKGGNNRIILATDGDFNVGVSSNGGMEQLVEEKREKGVFITVLGFGMGNYKDDKMEIIADKGNGNYAYIDNLQEAQKVLVQEFGGTLFTIAKDVKFQIEFNPAFVKAYRLVGYENRLLNNEDFNDDTKDAGEMGSGHTVTALYELIPAGSDENVPSVDPLKYQENNKPAKNDTSNEMLTIKLRYKEPDGLKSRLYEKGIVTRVKDISQTSDRFRFAAAVAGFGMLLRNSEYKGTASYDDIISLAAGSKGEDEDGYRSEFIRLVKLAKRGMND